MEEKLRAYLKHEYSTSLPDQEKSNTGKYYTPAVLVDLVRELVRPHLTSASKVIDPAAGYGAFLDHFESHEVIAADIDPSSQEVLNSLGFRAVFCDNSLKNVSRAKYGLSDRDHLVVVGNPPYNDVTSLNKKYGPNSKQKLEIEMDEDIRSQDYGISFLRAFDKLEADVVCVLHPFAYLLKRNNFSKLKAFPRHYRLADAVIFSSKEFTDTSKTPFPVVAALYRKDARGMDHAFVREFRFRFLNEKSALILKNIPTSDDDDYIRKYQPPKDEKGIESDIGLYMFNFRDINSLLVRGNLIAKIDYDRHITIHFKELYKYAYLNALRRHFAKDYRFGNLSPIVERDRLENDPFFRDCVMIDTILANQKLPAFDRENKDSILYSRGLLENWNKRKAPENAPDIYAMIRGELEPVALRKYLRLYFDDLKSRLLSN